MNNQTSTFNAIFNFKVPSGKVHAGEHGWKGMFFPACNIGPQNGDFYYTRQRAGTRTEKPVTCKVCRIKLGLDVIERIVRKMRRQ